MGVANADDQFSFRPGGSLHQILIGLNVASQVGEFNAERFERVEVVGGGGSGSDRVVHTADSVANELLLIETGPLSGKVRESSFFDAPTPVVGVSSATHRGPVSHGQSYERLNIVSRLKLEVEFYNLGETFSRLEVNGGGGGDRFAVEHLSGWQVREVVLAGGGSSPDPAGRLKWTGSSHDDLVTYRPAPTGQDTFDVLSQGASTQYSLVGIPNIDLDGRGQTTIDQLVVQSTCSTQHMPGIQPGIGTIWEHNCGPTGDRMLNYRDVESVVVGSSSRRSDTPLVSVRGTILAGLVSLDDLLEAERVSAHKLTTRPACQYVVTSPMRQPEHAASVHERRWLGKALIRDRAGDDYDAPLRGICCEMQADLFRTDRGDATGHDNRDDV
jgi:hypothetical protein